MGSGIRVRPKSRSHEAVVSAPPSMTQGAAPDSLHRTPESLIAPPQQPESPPGLDEQPEPAQVPQLREQLQDRCESGRARERWVGMMVHTTSHIYFYLNTTPRPVPYFTTLIRPTFVQGGGRGGGGFVASSIHSDDKKQPQPACE